MNYKTENPWGKIFTMISLPNNHKPWLEVRCDKDEQLFLAEFVEQMDNLPHLNDFDHPILFRGQSDAGWTLKPKLFRLWDRVLTAGMNEQEILKKALLKELDSIRYFQQRALFLLEPSRVLGHDLNWRNIGDWLTIMQHYSAPTRFLDWTSSFFVALYFAVVDNRIDGAVWLLRSDILQSYLRKHPEQISISESERDEIIASYDKFVEFGSRANNVVSIYGNEIKTERIIAQHSIFTFSYYLFTDHANVLGERLSQEDPFPLIKIIIPANLKQKIRLKLTKMNISNETLFPGIDGVGRSITEKIELYQENLLYYDEKQIGRMAL